jgi:ribosomal protein S18 acetylase RimI-like enzyme
VVGPRRQEILDVHSLAHGRSAESARQQMFADDTLPRHAAREGFRFLAALESDGSLGGFAYGYTGASGQWWHDQVARAMDAATFREWLQPLHFEFCELAVRPDLQGIGLGGALHDALLADRPEPRALLSTARDDNDAVIAFYERRGWRIVVPDLVFQGAFEPFCVMGRELAAR